MSLNLSKRLQALEGLRPVRDTEQRQKLQATIEAIFATVSVGGVDVSAELDGLAGRIKSQATTDADRALMESWPKCHMEPAQLLCLVAGVRDTY